MPYKLGFIEIMGVDGRQTNYLTGQKVRNAYHEYDKAPTPTGKANSLTPDIILNARTRIALLALFRHTKFMDATSGFLTLTRFQCSMHLMVVSMNK